MSVPATRGPGLNWLVIPNRSWCLHDALCQNRCCHVFVNTMATMQAQRGASQTGGVGGLQASDDVCGLREAGIERGGQTTLDAGTGRRHQLPVLGCQR